MRIAAILGSMREKGNTEILLDVALDEAEQNGATVSKLALREMTIGPCDGCSACFKTGECVIKDDMEKIYPKLISCDALILGSPVYFGDVTGLTKAFIDRTTCLGGTPATELQYSMKWKIGGAITVGGTRHGGQEFTLKTIHNFFLVHGMLVVSGIPSAGYWGAAGQAVERDEISKDGIPGRISTMEMCEDLGWRVATAAKYFTEGKKKFGDDLLHFTKK